MIRKILVHEDHFLRRVGGIRNVAVMEWNYGDVQTAKRSTHLVFSHCTGFSKEMWIPVVEDLMGMFAKSKNTYFQITSIDLAGHGDTVTNFSNSMNKNSQIRKFLEGWRCFGQTVDLVMNDLKKKSKQSSTKYFGVGLSKGIFLIFSYINEIVSKKKKRINGFLGL